MLGCRAAPASAVGCSPAPGGSFPSLSVPHGCGFHPTFLLCSKGHGDRPERLGTLGTRLHSLPPTIKSPQDSKEGQDAAVRVRRESRWLSPHRVGQCWWQAMKGRGFPRDQRSNGSKNPGTDQHRAIADRKELGEGQSESSWRWMCGGYNRPHEKA